MYFEDRYLIDTREVDHQGQCRPSAVLGFLQETATVAAIRLGIDREILLDCEPYAEEYGAAVIPTEAASRGRSWMHSKEPQRARK